jgi:FkbM family methyltransferase
MIIMFLIREGSFNTEDPIYQKLPNTGNVMFIPEARVAKDYFSNVFYERHFINWVLEQDYLKADKNVLDIGAHIGWYTVAMAKKAKHVYAFECSPKSFNYLCANIALNDLHYKVTKYNCALSDVEGSVDYFVRDPNDGGGNGITKFGYDEDKNTKTIKVPAKTLDSFGLDNISFIKLDVEGHELQVLKGAVETIKKNNYPKIFFESWDPDKDAMNLNATQLRKDLFAFVMEIGYKIVRVGVEMYIAERV